MAVDVGAPTDARDGALGGIDLSATRDDGIELGLCLDADDNGDDECNDIDERRGGLLDGKIDGRVEESDAGTDG